MGVPLLALIFALPMPVAAQWRAPRPERTTARAIAVLETFQNGAQRLVPVALYYERRYYDAGLYRAAPVPFTLSRQTVYEVQRFGKPLGTFTLWTASRAPEGLWVGAGVFRTAPDSATLAKAKKPAPVTVEDPTRPVLHRRAGSEGDRPVARANNAPASVGEEDPERPRLQRREDPQSATQADEQGHRSTPDAVASAAEAPPEADAGRPVLRRGKPGQEQSGADLPAPSGPAEPKPESVARQVAVSDAASSEAQELLFAASEAQRQQMESEARELARSELLRLAPMRGLSLPATPAVAAQPMSGVKLPGFQFEDQQFVAYDLDYKDYATVVYSARCRPVSAAPSAGTATDRSWVVTVIARQDGAKLARIFSAVSDPRELDLYPEVRLVDAVDPEGYGRFSLLFRERKRDGVSWLIGRIAGFELQTVFQTAAR